MNLIPVEDKIIGKLVEASNITAGGVVIPDIENENTLIAEVIKVGPGRWRDKDSRFPMETKIGDKIVFLRFVAQQFNFEDDTYVVVREPEILGRIGEENNTEKKLLND